MRDDVFKDALFAYRVVIKTTLDTFGDHGCAIDARDPRVLAETVDAAYRTMRVVMDSGGLTGAEADD